MLGKHRILVSLLGVYAAYAVVSLANFDFVRDPQTKTLFFLAILIGFVVMFSRIIRGSVSGHGPAFYAKMTIGTAIVIGLSLSIILGWYPAKDLVKHHHAECADILSRRFVQISLGDCSACVFGNCEKKD